MAGNHEMPIDVHGLIAKSFSKEYVEAVVTDALHILPSYKDRKDSLVVINARRVAIILDKQTHRTQKDIDAALLPKNANVLRPIVLAVLLVTVLLALAAVRRVVNGGR